MTPSAAVEALFDLIMLFMLIRVLLSWFPNVNWFNEPFRSLRKYTDYIFGPFRRIIPPIGMIDISPIIAFLAVSLIQRLMIIVLVRFGL